MPEAFRVRHMPEPVDALIFCEHSRSDPVKRCGRRKHDREAFITTCGCSRIIGTFIASREISQE